MKTQKFVLHCRAISKLMKRLAILANQLDDDCALLAPSGGPYERIRQHLLEAFGLTEAIRHAHLPHIDAEDPPTAFVMGLALHNLVARISTMGALFLQLDKRPKTLPKYLPREMRQELRLS